MQSSAIQAMNVSPAKFQKCLVIFASSLLLISTYFQNFVFFSIINIKRLLPKYMK